MVIRELLVELGLTFDEKGLKRIEEKLGSFKKVVGEFAGVIAGGLALRELTSVVNETTQAAVSLSRMALTFGMTAEQLEALQFSAERSGASTEQLQMAFSRLAVGVQQAADGSKEAQHEFTKLGLHIRDSKGQIKPVNELFLETADKMKAMKNPAEKAAMAVRLFGRGGVALIPLLERGSDGIQAMGADLDHLGAAMDEDFIKSSKAYRSEVSRENKALDGLKMAITKAVLPAFTKFTHLMAEAIGWFNRIQKNTDFLRVLFITLGAVAVGLAIKMLLPWAPYIAMVTFAAIATFFLVGAIEDLWMFLSGGESVIGDLIKSWGTFVDEFANPDHVDPNEHWLITFLRSVIDLAEKARKAVAPLFSDTLRKKDRQEKVGLVDQKDLLPSEQAVPVDMQQAEKSGGLFSGGLRHLLEPIFGKPAQQFSIEGGGKGALTYAPTNYVEVTVNAETGASGEEIAGHVKRVIEEHDDSKHQSAYHALVPALAPR